MPPANPRPRASLAAAPLFILLLATAYIGCFAIGHAVTGTVIGGIAVALCAPCLLLVLGALLPSSRYRLDRRGPR